MSSFDLSQLESDELVLLVAPGNMLQDLYVEVLNHFVNERGAACVYVTVAKPYKTVNRILKERGIQTEKMLFIDCISMSGTGAIMERAGNCIFCRPESLMNISIAMTNAFRTLPPEQERVLIMDTLSTLLLYNEAKIVGRFVHSLSVKLREWGVKSVIFMLEEGNQKEIAAISQFCDKTLNAQACVR